MAPGPPPDQLISVVGEALLLFKLRQLTDLVAGRDLGIPLVGYRQVCGLGFALGNACSIAFGGTPAGPFSGSPRAITPSRC
jgi:hypothetical protein